MYAADPPPLVRDPARIPLSVLRDFAARQAEVHGIRAVAQRWGVGYETFRKFVQGSTRLPHPRQREIYGARFLAHHPAGYLPERPDAGAAPLRPLKLLLPASREKALGVLERIFALAAAQPDAPRETGAVGAWARRVLEAEYAAEGRVALRTFPPARRSPQRAPSTQAGVQPESALRDRGRSEDAPDAPG
jgi:hypothetical protein